MRSRRRHILLPALAALAGAFAAPTVAETPAPRWSFDGTATPEATDPERVAPGLPPAACTPGDPEAWIGALRDDFIPRPAETATFAEAGGGAPDPFAGEWPAGTVGEREAPTGDHYESGFWRGVGLDTRDLALSPARWDRGDWLRAGVVVAAIGAVGSHDASIDRSLGGWGGGGGNRIAGFGDALGDGRISLPLIASFYVYGRAAHDGRAYDTSRLAFESFALSGLFTAAGKLVFGRARPIDRHGGKNDADSFRAGGSSFPSGHTAVAFAVATVFARQYSDHRWVPPLAYSLAGLTGLARIHDRAHWASDVLAGAAVGYFTGSMLTRRHGGGEWTVSPTFGGGSRGAALTVRW